MRIVGDSGHGGRDPGAIGPTGLQEKSVTLPVVKRLAEYLSTACEVKLTRVDDRHLGPTKISDLAARVKIAEDFKADFFISVHCNSSTNPEARGTEIFTTPGQGKSDPVAESIIQSWQKEFPDMIIRKDMTDGDSDKEENFYVIKNTKMPAVLIELAFISNPVEEQLLADPVFQDRAAKAIATGIANYYGLRLTPDKFLIPSGYVNVLVENTVITGLMVGGKTYAPVRALAEALGAKVDWDDSSKTAVIKKGD